MTNWFTCNHPLSMKHDILTLTWGSDIMTLHWHGALTHLEADVVTCLVWGPGPGPRLVTLHHFPIEALQSSVSQPKLSRGGTISGKENFRSSLKYKVWWMHSLAQSRFSIIQWKAFENMMFWISPGSLRNEAYLNVKGINQNNEMRLFSVNKIIALNNLWCYLRSRGGQ